MGVLNMRGLAKAVYEFATASQACNRALGTSRSRLEVATGGAADTSHVVVEQPGLALVRGSGSQC